MPELSPERWRRLSPHLDRALEMSDDERLAWLGELRAGDAALADDLEALLAERGAEGRAAFLDATPRVQSETSLAGKAFGAGVSVRIFGSP